MSAKTVAGGVFGALVLVGAVGAFVGYQTVHTTQTCTVEDKDRSTSSDGGSVYQVYTEDCGTLRIEDSLLNGQFDSADQYAAIDVGQTYEFTTYGVRIPILSAFPIIVEAEQVQS